MKRVIHLLARLRYSPFRYAALLWLALLFSLACAAPSPDNGNDVAQPESVTTPYPPVIVQDSERRELQSEYVDETFKLHVYFPRGYDEMSQPLPVVYLLDAEYSFGAVAYTIRRLIKDSLIVPVLLVGVSYEVPYDDYYARRERDFTPTTAHLNDFPNAGHAADFVEFLRAELIPLVNRTYKVDPDDRTIAGLSFSGLFATYALFQHSDLFDRYLIVSPSLWWDGGVAFRYESQYAASNAELRKDVYVAAGERDGRAILRDLRRLRVLLGERRYEGLRYEITEFPDETHRTVFPIAVSHGLRFLFGGRR
jgi:predicted alpha/beta superfamily hydrolase